MRRITMLNTTAALVLACAAWAGAAQAADTMVLDCYNVKGKVVACKGNYPDGTAAANADFTLFSKAHLKLGSGKTDEHGVYLFKAPPDEYIVVIGIAPDILTSLDSGSISSQPQRPGWNGDWVPVAAVDRLDQLKQWEDQFLSEKGPLIQKIEDNINK